ncbi:hypothetical protein IV203_030369 [Nitzschia inconspicua]|uniref:Uncharacterized protein n=1 Tax=Nitzschia inconspicua TaxID=303405 RepID=A0A9K3LTF4_9STRA|nr:hypothetical protein IV203_030369 [Nitzschia inconspicua]
MSTITPPPFNSNNDKTHSQKRLLEGSPTSPSLKKRYHQQQLRPEKRNKNGTGNDDRDPHCHKNRPCLEQSHGLHRSLSYKNSFSTSDEPVTGAGTAAAPAAGHFSAAFSEDASSSSSTTTTTTTFAVASFVSEPRTNGSLLLPLPPPSPVRHKFFQEATFEGNQHVPSPFFTTLFKNTSRNERRTESTTIPLPSSTPNKNQHKNASPVKVTFSLASKESPLSHPTASDEHQIHSTQVFVSPQHVSKKGRGRQEGAKQGIQRSTKFHSEPKATADTIIVSLPTTSHPLPSFPNGAMPLPAPRIIPQTLQPGQILPLNTP